MTRRSLLTLLPASFVRPARAADPSFERIDCHLHVHRSAPVLVQEMQKAGWRALSICVSRAVGDDRNDVDEQLRETPKLHRESKGRIAWAAAFDARDWESPDFSSRTIADLKNHFDNGAIAVKIWKSIGMAIRSKWGDYLLPDNPVLRPVYRAIQQADRTLIAHLAEPNGAWMPLDEKNPEIRFYSTHPEWHMLNKPGTPKKAEILAARDRIAELNPKLRIIGCHLGSNEEDLVELSHRLDRHKNLAVDMAARVRYFANGDRETARAFLGKYADRVLYGSDTRVNQPNDEQVWKSLGAAYARDYSFLSTSDSMTYGTRQVRGLALPEKVLRQIFYENPVRWLPGIVSG
jgi:hypothetical protein